MTTKKSGAAKGAAAKSAARKGGAKQASASGSGKVATKKSATKKSAAIDRLRRAGVAPVKARARGTKAFELGTTVERTQKGSKKKLPVASVMASAATARAPVTKLIIIGTPTTGRRRVSAERTLPAAVLTPALSSVIEIAFLEAARKFVPQINIHPRKIIPPVPEGKLVADVNPTPPLALETSVPMAVMMSEAASVPGGDGGPLTDDNSLVLVRNVQLSSVADNDAGSHVNEPSVASNGEVVFYTGNWYAAISLDGGATFKFVDPYTSFPDPPGLKFCCDQVVHYIESIDTFVWSLQYMAHPQTGENVQRLAFAKTEDVKLGRWRLFDISSQSVGQPGRLLDFPDLSVGRNMLYLTTNSFEAGHWRAAVLVRIPLAGISSGTFTAEHTTSTENSGFRMAQYCATRLFWAAHETTSSLRIFSWDESEPQPSFHDATVASWSAGSPPYSSQTPDGRNWLGRADPRLTGGAKTGNELWFAWGSNSGGANNRPHPFVQIARLDAATFKLIDNFNIWDAEAGVAYAGLASNANGEVGVSYAIGGGGRFPTHVVGILSGVRKEVTTFISTRGPDNNKWGDYLTVRRHYPNQKLFAATGYTLQSGEGNSDAAPNFTLFGRALDVS